MPAINVRQRKDRWLHDAFVKIKECLRLLLSIFKVRTHHLKIAGGIYIRWYLYAVIMLYVRLVGEVLPRMYSRVSHLTYCTSSHHNHCTQ